MEDVSHIKTTEQLSYCVLNQTVAQVLHFIDEHQIDINAYYFAPEGLPILSYCLKRKGTECTQLLESLRANGADPLNVSRGLGLNLLHSWVIFGQTPDFTVLKSFLGKNFKRYLNMRDKFGRTPLFLSYSLNSQDKTRVLLEYHPDLSLTYIRPAVDTLVPQSLEQIIKHLHSQSTHCSGPHNLILEYLQAQRIKEHKKKLEKIISPVPSPDKPGGQNKI